MHPSTVSGRIPRLRPCGGPQVLMGEVIGGGSHVRVDLAAAVRGPPTLLVHPLDSPLIRELRKPLFAMSCAFDRKIYRSQVPVFTARARSATINHNNLATCELRALILGTQRGGLESEFLLRARRGSEANRRRDGDRRSRTARTPASDSPSAHSPLFRVLRSTTPSPT
jgi:hypothetical protein